MNLSNFRWENDNFDRQGIAVDYKRTRTGSLYPMLAGKSPSGELSLMGFSLSGNDSGTIRLGSMFHRDSISDVELYVVARVSLAEEVAVTYLLSNAVRLGNPGSVTTARPMNSQEQAAYAKQQLDKAPPAGLPSGYVHIDKLTKLTPGLPVAAAHYGEWLPGGLLAHSKTGSVTVKLERNDKVRKYANTDWIAVDASVLQKMKSDPKQFAASVQVLPDGVLPIPSGAVPLSSALKLVVGTPLLLESPAKWDEVFLVSENGDSIKVRQPNQKAVFDREYPRSKFVITNEVVSKLSSPGAEKEFGDNIDEEESNTLFSSASGGKKGAAGSSHKPLKDYPVSAKPPKGAEFVPDDVFIPADTALAAFWGSRWYAVTVIDDSKDGAIEVHWIDFPASAWDCSIRRKQLIIETKVLRKLQAAEKKKGGTIPVELRTWTDASGKFSVEAYFVSKSATEVVLKTEVGKELKIPIAKLCDEDQKFVSKIEDNSVNPFAVGD